MNVLFFDKDREFEIATCTISLMDFVFMDLGDGLYQIIKNRTNGLTGKITRQQCRDLITQWEAYR